MAPKAYVIDLMEALGASPSVRHGAGKLEPAQDLGGYRYPDSAKLRDFTFPEDSHYCPAHWRLHPGCEERS